MYEIGLFQMLFYFRKRLMEMEFILPYLGFAFFGRPVPTTPVAVQLQGHLTIP